MGTFIHSVLAFVLALSSALSPSKSFSTKSEKSGEFFRFWNVGQGDLMTYVGSEVCWFFDLGGEKPLNLKILENLKSQCFHKKISAFISHFDKDHIRYYKRMDEFLNIDELIVSHMTPLTLLGKNMLAYFRKKGVPILIMKNGEERRTLSASIKCLWPWKTIKKNENSKSLVLLFQNRKNRILLMGDLPGSLEKNILPGPIDILKVGHHGSQSSTTDKFLGNIKAKSCVISVGKNNKYQHPRASLLLRLKKAQCAILRTDDLGSVQLNF